MKIASDQIAWGMFLLSLMMLAFGYGYVCNRFEIFPYGLIQAARSGYKALMLRTDAKLPWFYRERETRGEMLVYKADRVHGGLNLVTSFAADHELSAKIINMDGRILHKWKVDWFDVWPDPQHLPGRDIPKSKPGSNIHGAVVLPNGDLIFNYENLGMVRLNICSDVVWRLAYRTHHSLHLDDHGDLWTSGRRDHEKPFPGFRNLGPPFEEPTILQVSPDGRILREISVVALLQQNGLSGLLYLTAMDNWSTQVKGDTLHLNDVEPFAKQMQAGVFEAGDVMISLRNINTVLVFRLKNLKIKYMKTGSFVRQHDPDFMDGNTISIFDNNNIGPWDHGQQSRILVISATDDGQREYYTGNNDVRFYSDIMGKHQWLPNGNLLITEAANGRAFEIDTNGKIVWEFVNIVHEGVVGAITEVQRLPEAYVSLFTDEHLASVCGE